MKGSITVSLLTLLTICSLSGVEASCLRFDISDDYYCPSEYMAAVRNRVAENVAQEAMNMDLISDGSELIVTTEGTRRHLGAGRQLNFCQFHGCGGIASFVPQYCW